MRSSQSANRSQAPPSPVKKEMPRPEGSLLFVRISCFLSASFSSSMPLLKSMESALTSLGTRSTSACGRFASWTSRSSIVSRAFCKSRVPLSTGSSGSLATPPAYSSVPHLLSTVFKPELPASAPSDAITTVAVVIGSMTPPPSSDRTSGQLDQAGYLNYAVDQLPISQG